MRHIMIDNENVHLKSIPDLGTDPCELWLFAGNKQDKLPTELTSTLLTIQNQGIHKVHLIKIDQTGDNALDFCLTYQMGLIVKEYGAENVCFCIYSKDKGFDAVINHMLDQSPPHCAYAVRIEEPSQLKLSEAELKTIIIRPKKINSPTNFFKPAAPRPLYRSSNNAYAITVNIGAGLALEALLKDPALRARRAEHLIFRLREHALKNWLTYPEPKRTQLLNDIVENLKQQSFIVPDEETGLFNYHIDFIKRANVVVAKLYDLIKLDSPKPPRTREKLINVLKTYDASRQLSDQDFEKILKICELRALLQFTPNGDIAYRNLNTTSIKKPEPVLPTFRSLSEDLKQINQYVYQTWKYLIENNAEPVFTINKSSIKDIIRQKVLVDLPIETNEMLIDDLEKKIVVQLHIQRYIASTEEETLATVNHQYIKNLNALLNHLITHVVTKPNRPYAKSKFTNLLKACVSKYGFNPDNEDELNFIMRACVWRNLLSTSKEYIAYNDSVQLLPVEETSEMVETIPQTESVWEQVETTPQNKSVSAQVEVTSQNEPIFESVETVVAPQDPVENIDKQQLSDADLLELTRKFLQHCHSMNALPKTDLELLQLLPIKYENLHQDDAARAVFLLVQTNEISFNNKATDNGFEIVYLNF